MVQLPPAQVMRKAFAEKDPAFEGTFFVAVKTTSIFCRPVCRAKRPLARNIEFYPTAQAAMHAGFRPCKLCKPLESAQPPALVRKLIEFLEHQPGRVTERDLRAMGIEPTTARRQFRAAFKTTFARWQRSRCVGEAVRNLNNGANMITAQLTAGFESASGFRDALTRLYPGTSLQSGAANMAADWIATPLGAMIAIAGERGIVMLDFIDKDGFDKAIDRMKRKLGNAAIVPSEHRDLTILKKQLAEYFAGKRRNFSVRLDPHGSDFELRVWLFLRSIPYGQTRTYGQQAQAMGSISAARAVGAANGRNDISILIPCHRVIGASGSLIGYGGGLERKKWLLNHERSMVGGELF